MIRHPTMAEGPIRYTAYAKERMKLMGAIMMLVPVTMASWIRSWSAETNVMNCPRAESLGDDSLRSLE